MAAPFPPHKARNWFALSLAREGWAVWRFDADPFLFHDPQHCAALGIRGRLGIVLAVYGLPDDEVCEKLPDSDPFSLLLGERLRGALLLRVRPHQLDLVGFQLGHCLRRDFEAQP